VFLETMLITAVLAGGLAAFVLFPIAGDEPRVRSWVRLVPLALIVGVVLAWASAL